jgi:type IV pilus assembly protein PilA
MRTAQGAQSGDRDELGFTLIELMIVVLIIAILIAVALPTFLGARQKAQDRAAQANLRTGLTAIKTAYADSQSYVTAASQLSSLEPSLRYVTGASSSGQQVIAVAAVDDQDVGMAVLGGDGVCWQLFDAASGTGTTYGSVRNSTSTTCTAPGEPLSATSW